MMRGFGLAVCLALTFAPTTRAQDNDPKYPQVNLATVWTVDAK